MNTKRGYKLGPMSDEHKSKIGNAQRGEKNHAFGKIPWNKGKKGVQIVSEETRKKMSAIKKEWYRMHPERKEAISRENSGSNHWKWSGSPKDSRTRAKFAPRPKPLHCEICGSYGRICLDHCHETNEFRGWLCDRCNVAIGMAKENPEVLRSLAEYIERALAKQMN